MRRSVTTQSAARNWLAEGGWTPAASTDGTVADLGSVGAGLDVRELYEAAREGSA